MEHNLPTNFPNRALIRTENNSQLMPLVNILIGMKYNGCYYVDRNNKISVQTQRKVH